MQTRERPISLQSRRNLPRLWRQRPLHHLPALRRLKLALHHLGRWTSIETQTSDWHGPCTTHATTVPMKRHVVLVPILLAAALAGAMARADDPDKARARECFKHAVALFDDKRFADSLAEFERSYALAPVFSTLYNIGQVHVALGHPVEAVDAFEKFLAQGGSSIPPDQRTRVENELAAQRARVGEIVVAVRPPGAEVRLDGKVLGRAPLTAPVKAAAGHHRVEAMLDGYRSQSREMDLQGKGRVELAFELEPLRSQQPAAAAQTPLAPVQAQPTPKPVSSAAAAPPPAPDTRPESAGSAQRILGGTLGAVGLVGAGIGIVIAVKGQSKHEDALDQWWGGDHAGARQTESDANAMKLAGGVTIGAGAALAICGGVLLVTAPSPRSKVAVAPWVSPTVAGVGLRTTW